MEEDRAPQPRRLQVVDGGMVILSSSESGSGSGAGAGPVEVGRCGFGWGAGREAMGWGGGAEASVGGSGTGVSSMAEWTPVVQGGMARNSSKVRVRGLQHFQPGESRGSQQGWKYVWK